MKTPVQVIYIGGPTVIIEIAGLRIMTDPTLDPPGNFPAGPNDFIEKLSGPAIHDVGHIDMVLLSHDQHADNLDKMGRKLITEVKKTYSTKGAAERLMGSVAGLAPWETASVQTPTGETLTITATPARHGPINVERFAGEVIGFVLSLSGPEQFELYLTGDTVFYEGVKEVAAKFKPKYVFIFAGAAKPPISINLTMDTNDAIDTAFTFPDAMIIPVHYEGWSHYSETGDMIIQSFAAFSITDRLKMLEAGKKTSLP